MLVAGEMILQTDPPAVPARRPRLGQSGAESEFETCLFVSPFFRGFKQETHVPTHPTGCSVLCDSHIPVCQPLTQPHTNRQIQFQSRQHAKHRKKKNLNRPDLLGSILEQRIMGALTPLAFWEGSSRSPVCSLSRSLSVRTSTLYTAFVYK